MSKSMPADAVNPQATIDAEACSLWFSAWLAERAGDDWTVRAWAHGFEAGWDAALQSSGEADVKTPNPHEAQNESGNHE
jgi:hypothetical protein